MTGKRVLVIALSLALVLGSVSMAFGETAQGSDFADMPDNWSTEALSKAVENKLLQGYSENGEMLIKADNPLTRAEMAAVVNRAFGSTVAADISSVTDVSPTAWYAKDMAKAVQMGTFALAPKMRPEDKITRQEAFAVLARAFKLASTDTDYKALDKFTDKSGIAAWALKDLNGMAAAGYIQGAGNKLNPTANITRAEFAVVMDNLVKQYIDAAGTLTEVVAQGNVMIRVPGVTLQNVTVKGDLIIADGVGDGDVTLDGAKVEGRTIIRGGGEDSIIIKGNSDLGKVIVARVDGKIRISIEGNADVEVIYVDDGSDDVFVEGTIGTLEVAGDNVTVTATKATITSAAVSGDNSYLILGAGTTLKTGSITGKASGITVGQGATVDKLTVSGSDATIDGQGTLKDVEVVKGGDDAAVTTPNTVIKVAGEVKGVTAGGGKEVPAGATATNNAAGTDAKVDEEPSMGGGGGGGVPTPGASPTLTLVSVKIGNGDEIDTVETKEVSEEGKTVLYYLIKSEPEWDENTSLEAVVSGKNFKDDDDYVMKVEVSVDGGMTFGYNETIAGNRMNRDNLMINDLFKDRVKQNIIDDLIARWARGEAGDKVTVTISYKDGKVFKELWSARFELI